MWAKKNRPTSIEPIRAVEWVIAVCAAVGGIYVFTPLYELSVLEHGPRAFAAALSHPAFIVFWGILILIGAILVIVGLYENKPQLKSVGWFTIILARFFQLLTIWTVLGLLPLTWIYPFTLMLVMIVLWGKARVDVSASNER